MAEPAIASGIDHPVIAVRDMSAGRAAFDRLGFTITPRGRHREWGTGNWCIMFERVYLELRGIIDPAMQNPEHALPERDGLMGLALATSDAEASYAELVRRGLHPRPVKRLTRDFELPEGTVQPRFSLCFLSAAETPGLMSVVFCQHMTPGLLRRPEWLRHTNGARGVRKVTGVVPDLAAAAAVYSRIFGEQALVKHSGRLVINAGDKQKIELLTPAAARETWAGREFASADPNGRLLSISLDVEDLNQTVQQLAASGVELQQLPTGELSVSSRECCGVPLEFMDSKTMHE
jgi:catechol 2,3-dioxygenase-like lactoylglutathione lyase family enzyme